MMPPRVSVLFATLIVELALSVTLPVPRFKLFVPVKLKSAAKVTELLLVSVMSDPLELSIVPPLMVNTPIP